MAYTNVLQLTYDNQSYTLESGYRYRLYNSTSSIVEVYVYDESGTVSKLHTSVSARGYASVDLPLNVRYQWQSLYTVSGVYLQREPINTAPTTPGAFTAPTGELEIGDVRTIAWGASSDAEGNFSNYRLEYAINGGNWTDYATPTSPSATMTIPNCTSIKFRVKARDTLGLDSAYRESPVFTVTKPKYYYSKYNVAKYNYYTEPGWSYGGNQNGGVNFASTYKSYSFDSSTGNFAGTGGQWGNNFPYVGATGYAPNGKSINKFTITGDSYFDTYFKSSVPQSTDVRGSLIQSGIIAVDGTYPNDGKHTDGYWYVRGSRVNQSITPPGGFTAPSIGKVFKPGELAAIAFSASTASNLSLYEVDYRYNNDAWQALAYNNTLNRQLTITNDKTKATIEFRVRAKNTSGVYSDYVYSDIFTIQHNTAPTITLNTENNLELSAAVGHNEIVVDGFTKDVDQDNALVVKLQINEGTIRNIASGISDGNTAIFFNKILTYSDKRIFDGTTPISNELAEGVDHKLKVWTDDGITTSKVEERNFRVIHNRPPVISDTDRDLGTLIESPSVPYQVNDLEGNEITVTEKIDGHVIRTFKAEPNTEYTLEIPLDKWIRLRLETHAATIEATDSAGLTSVRTYTFTRTENTIQLELKNPFETDVAATRILVTPEVYVPIGASILIEACNNAFDETPAWEDITSMAMANRGYNFVNTTKTAEQWGINIRFTLEKGTATQEVRFEGFGGAFD